LQRADETKVGRLEKDQGYVSKAVSLYLLVFNTIKYRRLYLLSYGCRGLSAAIKRKGNGSPAFGDTMERITLWSVKAAFEAVIGGPVVRNS